MIYSSIFLIFLLPFLCNGQTFTNPISDRISPDPQILFWGGSYYMVLSDMEKDMILYKSDKLTDFRNTLPSLIHQSTNQYDACWAPELHVIEGEVYCYFSMHKIGENDHRMWVSKAVNSSDIMGDWEAPMQLMKDEAQDANDGTVFKHPTNGKMYFVFTRLRRGIHNSALYIAPMSDAYTVEHPRILLRIPEEGTWECRDACLNEGANMLIGPNNVTHLVFSGSGSGSRNYALGRISILPELDPLVPFNWGPVHGPLFMEDESESVYGPGHAAFTPSPDGTETWMSYHAQNTSEPNNPQRIAYLDKVEWDLIGYPIFPKPHGQDSPQAVPSGQM